MVRPPGLTRGTASPAPENYWQLTISQLQALLEPLRGLPAGAGLPQRRWVAELPKLFEAHSAQTEEMMAQQPLPVQPARTQGPQLLPLERESPRAGGLLAELQPLESAFLALPYSALPSVAGFPELLARLHARKQAAAWLSPNYQSRSDSSKCSQSCRLSFRSAKR